MPHSPAKELVPGAAHRKMIRQLYDRQLNHGEDVLSERLGRSWHATFNDVRIHSAAELRQAYLRLHVQLGGARVQIQRASFDFETVVAPETIVNSAALWWIVAPPGARASPAAAGRSLIVFDDAYRIVELRENWPGFQQGRGRAAG